MKISGPFVSVENPDVLFVKWGLPDMQSREPVKARVHEGDLWKNELENMLMPMLEKYEAVIVDEPERLVHWP